MTNENDIFYYIILYSNSLLYKFNYEYNFIYLIVIYINNIK